MANASSWSRRIGRLKAMSRRELLDRLRQYGTARADLLRYRTGNNFSATPGSGSGARFGHFYFTSAEVPELMLTLKQILPAQAREIILRAGKICQHRFDLLGYEDLDYGAEIDWHLDVVHDKRGPRKPWFKIKYLDFEEVGDSKVTWELNRHQHFVTLAKAYWLTGDEKFAREIFVQWTHWHEQNPYPIGMNWASSLEVGFRSLSWIWTFSLLQECPLFTGALRTQWLAALSLNGRHIETYLSTYFSPNTHLLGEALSLFTIGNLFPGIRSAGRWRQRGWEILESGCATQVREDGFYFEQSTYYHVYALDMFLHARILAGRNGVPVPEKFDRTVERMLDVLLVLGRAGVAPSFGDDDGGRLFDPRRNRAEHMLDALATGAVLYKRGDFKFVADSAREETLWLLGLKGLNEFDSLSAVKPSGDSTALSDSGIYLLAEPESGRQQLAIDAGPLGAGSGGHGHADALSIALVQNGRSLLIDPGTFEYVGPSGERARLRGTGAHNTMQVDERNQAESTGPFSWRYPPLVKVERWITGRTFNFFQGSHDGYASLPSPVTHRRWVFHLKGSFWLVRDLAEGSGLHQLDISWHLGPSLTPVASKQIVFSDDRGALSLLTPENHGWSQSVHRDSWSPAYGHGQRASVVSFGAAVELPADFVTMLLTREHVPSDLGSLVRLNSSTPGGLCSFTYSNASQEHSFFFAGQRGPWAAGAWSSDADFLYWSCDRGNGQYTLVLCNGSYADAGGRRVLTCGEGVGYAEVMTAGAKVEVFSSHPDQVVLQQSLDQVWNELGRVSNERVPIPGNEPKGLGV
jgi:hypothetical protein